MPDREPILNHLIRVTRAPALYIDDLVSICDSRKRSGSENPAITNQPPEILT